MEFDVAKASVPAIEVKDEDFDKTVPENVFALELHRMIHQETSNNGHDVLAEAIATCDVELPELPSSSSSLDFSNDKITFDDNTCRSSELTVEGILGDIQLGGQADDGDFAEKINNLFSTPINGIKRHAPEDTDSSSIPGSKRHRTLYETLSPPESMSPLSEKNGACNSSNNNDSNEQEMSSVKEEVHSRKFLKEILLSPKLTNQFTMTQVAEMKKRIINTHKLILNFNFLKDGYARTCNELRKAMIKLKDSEYDRARLIKENQDMRRLVLELSKKLNEGN